jgi:hypothetical protein
LNIKVYPLFLAVDVLKVVTMDAATSLDATPHSSVLHQRFGGTNSLHLQGGKVREEALKTGKKHTGRK